MSSLPGFSKVGGIQNFSDLHFDKTFDESMQLLNGNSKRYTWLFDAIENSGEYSYDEEDVPFTREWGLYMKPEKIAGSIDAPIIYKDIQDMPLENGGYHYKHYDLIGSYNHEEIQYFKGQTPIGSCEYDKSLDEGISFIVGGRSIHINDYGIQLDGTKVQYLKDGQALPPYQIIYLEYSSDENVYHHDLGDDIKAVYTYEPNGGLSLNYVEGSLDQYVLSEKVLFSFEYNNERITVPLSIINNNSSRDFRIKMPIVPKSVQRIQSAWAGMEDIGVMKMHLSNLILNQNDEIFNSSGSGTVYMNITTYNIFNNGGRISIESNSNKKYITGTQVEVLVENE